MSVPTWRRNLSRTQFLYDLFQLNIRIGQIIANAPTQKYTHSYGNALVKTAQEALLYAQTGNDIYIVDDKTYETRREQFQLCRGCVANIATVAYIYLETMRRHDDIKPAKAAKMYDWEDEIGDLCDGIIKMLGGVMDNDREVWNEKKKEESGD